MFFSKTKAAQLPLQQQTNLQLLATLTSELSAIKANTAYISFTPDGKVLDANKKFLDIVGYSLAELVGQHHQLLCEAQYVASAEYRQFWQQLASGKAVNGTFLRFSKKRQPVYLEASYFPVQNDDGKVTKVIKIANDVTTMHHNLAVKEAVFTALDKSLAVIEFLPDGTILTANQNFLDSMQYQLTQLVGKPHKIFCDQEFYHSNPDFWRRLAGGSYASGRYKRLNSRGEVIWLEATYNPIFDESGKVFKVVKFAADISDRVNSALNAVEMAAATSEQTSQITTNAAKVLAEAIETSHQIANQVKKATDIGEQLMQQSKSIDDIVTTIRAIADQTNLLALNAAIEAARAGDSGRGFAVVADEVRKLAARTAGATAEISTVVQKNTVLIHDIDLQLTAINSTALHGEESINSVSAGLADVSNGVGQFVTMVEKLRP